MIGKTQLKKWLKEIIEPKVKPYGFKVGPEKKYSGGAFCIYKEDDEKIVFILIQVYNDDTVQISGFDVILLKLNEKIYNIIHEQNVLNRIFFYLLETHPYYYFVKNKDFSFRIPIKSREQLEDYIRPLLLNFVDSLKKLDYYLHIPHLIQKHDELQKIYDETGDYNPRLTFMPSPYRPMFIYFLRRVLGMIDHESYYNREIATLNNYVEESKQEGKMHLHETYTNFIKDFHLIKAHFESMSKEEKEMLRQDFLNPKLLAVKVNG